MSRPPTAVNDKMHGLTADLAQEQRALDAIVADLDEAGWDTATPADGWAVREAISHLAFFEDKAVLALTNPEQFTKEAETAQADLGAYMQQHVDRGRAMSGKELLSWWRAARGQTLERLGAASPGDRLPWYGPSMSAVSFARARVLETWAHGHDVADGLGIPLMATDRIRHIAELGVATRTFSYLVRGMPNPGGEVRVELTAPSGDQWTWGPTETDHLVRGPAEDFCLLVVHRRHRDDVRLHAHGALADEWLSLAQAFAGGPSAGRSPA